MTPDDVLACANAALAKWQPRLRLGHWQIAVRLDDEPQDGASGRMDGNWRRHKSVILVRRDLLSYVREHVIYDTDTPDEDIVEELVIHELLHHVEHPVGTDVNVEIEWLVGQKGVVGAPLRDTWKEYREWWINWLSRTLLEADRSSGWSRCT